MLQIINKLRGHKYFKQLFCLASLLILFLSYQLYSWSNTQSSDNAYLDADISNISAEINGAIVKVLVAENNKVKIGEIIAEIDATEYKAKFTQAVADLEVASKTIDIVKQQILIEQINLQKQQDATELAQINLDVVEADYKRTYELNKDSFASQKLLDTARVALAKAKSQYTQAVFGLQTTEQTLALLALVQIVTLERFASAKQMCEIAERNLSKTKILSPIDGILTNSALRIGNFVRVGTPLFSIVPYDKLYIRVNFKETQLAKLKADMQAMIVFDAIPKKKFYGHIRNISAATGAKFSLFPPDNATGNFTKIVQRVPVFIDFSVAPEYQNSLAPGMSAVVSIRTDQ